MLYDWEHEQVFDGYNPVVDGFAYPEPVVEPRAECYCTQDPKCPWNAIICEPCFARLLSES